MFANANHATQEFAPLRLDPDEFSCSRWVFVGPPSATGWHGTLVPRARCELALLLVWAVAGLRSRLDQGRRRGLAAISKKSLATWQHGNMATFFHPILKFPDFSQFSIFGKSPKITISKAPLLDFSCFSP